MRGVGISTAPISLQLRWVSLIKEYPSDISRRWMSRCSYIFMPIYEWMDVRSHESDGFCCRCGGHEKRSALIAQYYCEERGGACCHARAWNHWEQNEEKWRQRFTLPWGIRCLRIVCTYYNHTKHEPFAIYYQRFREKPVGGGVGFGGWLRDRSHPARRQSRTNPFLLSLSLTV